MADYIFTYDIPNEHRERLEQELTNTLRARREIGVSTFWRVTGEFSAAQVRDALKKAFPAIKLYVYEVNLANSATTEPTYDDLVRALRSSK
jgi:hypothetical protein